MQYNRCGIAEKIQFFALREEVNGNITSSEKF